MYFNQRGDISTLNGSSLKLVDKFTYLGSSVSSTEDIKTRLHKNAACNIGQILETTPQLFSYHDPSRKLDEADTDGQRQDDKLEPIYNSSVQIQDIALKISREQWTIEMGSEGGSEKSELVARRW